MVNTAVGLAPAFVADDQSTWTERVLV